jgi:2-amino-4-hydroxy-6-hydroxymethyldihydropteridine diphosphokinase
MSTCLIALGSNLGNRAATLDAAITEIDSLAGVTLRRQSRWHPTEPVGGGHGRQAFLNGAALCETSLLPHELVDALQAIETRHGRQRTKRWADRTLDLDLLLYGEVVLDSPLLTLPHPRMSFRRFVLEPAAEIAGELVHPTICWTLAQLLQHLDTGADSIAIISPDRRRRQQLTDRLIAQFPEFILETQVSEVTKLWPAELTTWIWIRPTSAARASTAVVNHPKLTILLDSETSAADADEEIANWTALCRQPGRGPTLRIPNLGAENMSREAFAALQAVWPALGPSGDKCVE